MTKHPYLSIIIPSYNEMVNLRKGVLDKIEHYLKKQGYLYEVIIADDGSTDGSAEFVEKFIEENQNFFLLKNQHLGKEGAVTKGMLSAVGEILLFTDMDQATPIEEIEKFLPEIKKGFDIVIGSRSSSRKGSPLSRVVMSKGMIILRKILVGMYNIEDTQCGFKMFNKKSSDELFNKIYELHHGFKKITGSNVTAGFDVELLYLATKMGFKIKEMPVEWLYVETRRVNPINDSINGVKDLLTIFINKFSGKYKI